MRFSISVGVRNYITSDITGKECESEEDARKSLLDEINRHIEICENDLRILKEAKDKVAA